MRAVRNISAPETAQDYVRLSLLVLSLYSI